MKATTSSYDQQATNFLAKHGLKFSLKQGSKECPWSHDGKSGNHYRITISSPKIKVPAKAARSTTFDFWGSIADRERMQEQNEEMKTLEGMLALYNSRTGSAPGAVADVNSQWKEASAKFHACHPSAYDVLACISGDVHCPETFEDFCAEYGYDEDSRKAEKQFKACHSFAQKLKAFFTKQEIEELSEIQ